MTAGWGEEQDRHHSPIIILLWVLSGLILGSAPLILREKIIVNLRNSDTQKLFNTPQRDLSCLIHTNWVSALAISSKGFLQKKSCTLLHCSGRVSGWLSFRFMQQIRCISVYARPEVSHIFCQASNVTKSLKPKQLVNVLFSQSINQKKKNQQQFYNCMLIWFWSIL